MLFLRHECLGSVILLVVGGSWLVARFYQVSLLWGSIDGFDIAFPRVYCIAA